MCTGQPFLVPCLRRLWQDFDLISPDRGDESDGWIGNKSHCPNADGSGSSDHCRDSRCRVHALDVDKDLRRPGLTMQMCVLTILNTPADRARLQYIIWNRTIWSRSWGWMPKAYTGDSSHTEHVHFSALRTDAARGDTRSWAITQFAQEDLMSGHGFASPEDARALIHRVKGLVDMVANIDTRTTGGGIQKNVLAATVQEVVTRQRTIDAKLDAVAQRVDIDATELAAIEQAAQRGASGIADVVVARILAALPRGDQPITLADVREAAERGVREAFSGGLASKDPV